MLKSPLKQISPILKKYSQYNRKILLKPSVKKNLVYDSEAALTATPMASPARAEASSQEMALSDKEFQETSKMSDAPDVTDDPGRGASEEAEDDEGDLAALMAASSTILRRKQALNRKRTRQQRDAEATLPLLVPGLVDADPLVGKTRATR